LFFEKGRNKNKQMFNSKGKIMKLSEINTEMNNLDLDEKQKKAIFNLIDLKVETEVKIVINKFNDFEIHVKNKFALLFTIIGFLGILITIYKFIE